MGSRIFAPSVAKVSLGGKQIAHGFPYAILGIYLSFCLFSELVSIFNVGWYACSELTQYCKLYLTFCIKELKWCCTHDGPGNVQEMRGFLVISSVRSTCLHVMYYRRYYRRYHKTPHCLPFFPLYTDAHYMV